MLTGKHILLRDGSIIIGENNADKITLSIMITRTHVHIPLNHMTISISYSRETLCSIATLVTACNRRCLEYNRLDNLDSRIKLFGSLQAATRKPILHYLIFVPLLCKSASFSLELTPFLAVSVDSLL